MAEILLIEGETELRDRISEALRASGHEVTAAENSEQARKASHRRVPALVISDQKLGDEGVEYLMDLAKDRRLARVPVILLVDGGSTDSALSTYQCDIFAILKKPIDVDALKLQVETVLRQTSRQKQSRKRERHELRSHIMRLEREVRATTADLTDAAQNFTTMLATPPRPQGIRIDVHFAPSGGFIGGDFYDFFWLDERRLCVVVGDVTGHGIQAAVIQSMARKVISIGMRIKNGDLREGLRFANDELADDIPQGKFVATLVGVLDVVSGNWQHARCGIPHPVFVKADGTREDVLTAGVALGLKRSANWADAIQVHNANLEPEGRVVMFTDGIIECVMDDGEEFDYKGVHKVLERAKLNDNVPELIHQAAHAGHRAVDDVLIISITREGVELEDSNAITLFGSLDDEEEIHFRS
ncbi:MAG: SpoIIE family protein phosphatase [Planctomycetes bacterium]|nr:SpoIIE family protein phosphatase [Planctomycetota bacterium]MCW8134666.1 SpoIIE family protein phosphatase [Planctomycetota bacterium]